MALGSIDRILSDNHAIFIYIKTFIGNNRRIGMTSASSKPSRNLALELVRVTEAAALMAAHYMGRDDKEAADQAAVDAMRYMLNSVEMEAKVIIGEGEKDEAPMLYNSEILGKGGLPKLDLAVDPIDGTRPLAQGRPNSIARSGPDSGERCP